MDLKYKLGTGRIVKKRDKAYGEMAFNDRYIEFIKQELKENTEKRLKKFELESKKRLLPLEIEASPKEEVNAEFRKQEFEEFTKKQIMPRRAIEQSAKRLEKKSGDRAGNEFRNKKLAELDKKVEDYKAKLLAKYPDANEKPTDAAVANYKNTTKAEEQKYTQLKEKYEAEDAKKVKSFIEKIDEKNKKLQKKLDTSNQELAKAYSKNESKLQDGKIMSIKNMKMYFSGIKAVDDLSFDIKEGDIFGLIGPNGAGKTTLFNCITQFYKATGGEIYYRDRFGGIVNLSDYQSHDVAATGIIRTFQNLALVPLISVIDNLMIGAHIYYRSNLAQQFLNTRKLKYEEKANRAMALDVLARLNLLEYKDQIPANLSYGVLKKVELARTLMSSPRMIILDEPAAGLNDVETEELANVIRKIRDDFNCTIFLVEHDMNLVMSVCDTVCAISFGKMLAIGTPQEIQANPVVQKAYLGEEDSI